MQWRSIKGFPDYEVSEFGDVRRITRPVAGMHADKPIPYLLKPGVLTKGYLGYSLVNRAAGVTVKTMSAHRLVAIAFLGDPPPDRPHVAHRDGNKRNNHYSNLYWADYLLNARDRVRHGRYARGADNNMSKLTEDKVREIRASYRPRDRSASHRALAKRFGVCQAAIKDILAGRHWKHIT
jgi:hypothetical protein